MKVGFVGLGRMGQGMADFAEKKVTTMAGYDLYCHYVAGLVGYGLSDLFASSGLEGIYFVNQKPHAFHFILFCLYGYLLLTFMVIIFCILYMCYAHTV